MPRKKKARAAWRMDRGAPAGWQRRLIVEMKDVYEVLCAGTVGSGKTDPGVMMPVVYRDYRTSPHFKALILRYNAKDLDKEIYQRITRADMWPRYVGGTLNETSGVYRMRSGGRAVFGHTKNLMSLRGAEYQYCYLDELTHWPDERDYLYVMTRMRSAQGLPIRVRAGTNPGGPGHEWVRRRWGPWLASDYLAKDQDSHDLYAGAASLRALGYAPRTSSTGKPLPPVDSGAVLHYTLDEDGNEAWAPPGTPHALTRTCIRTRTEDNVALAQSDPEYLYRVRAVGSVLRAQLGDDDWDVKGGGGEDFERSWFDVVEMPPANLAGVLRRWDFAWTKKKKSDWTVGVKLGWTKDGHWYVLHVVRMKAKPADVFATLRQTAKIDGIGVPVVIPLDGTAARVVEGNALEALQGFTMHSTKEVGTKETRISTIQPQAKAGRFHLVRGAWNEPFLDEVDGYDSEKECKDDQLDALAGAFLWATDKKKAPTMEQVSSDVRDLKEFSAKLQDFLDRPERVG